jgi:hypothetical protein
VFLWRTRINLGLRRPGLAPGGLDPQIGVPPSISQVGNRVGRAKPAAEAQRPFGWRSVQKVASGTSRMPTPPTPFTPPLPSHVSKNLCFQPFATRFEPRPSTHGGLHSCRQPLPRSL